MKRYRREGLSAIEPRPAELENVLANHEQRHVERIRASAGESLVAFDPDTYASRRSYETALLSTGGLLELIDRIMAEAESLITRRLPGLLGG